MSSAKIRVGLVGATGFTGKECLRLLAAHPRVEVAVLMSPRGEVPEASAYAGALDEPACEPFDPARLHGLDAVLCCAPHERAAAIVPDLVEVVATTIDLSAAFRLEDPALYAEHYGFAHPAPGLLGDAVFGLCEWARDELRGARLIANPGCFTTAVLLPLLALTEAKALVEDAPIVADCKSGVSGAGKEAGPVTHFASVYDDFRAYAVGRHRHEPEMRQALGSDRLYFTAHLLPLMRGILATIHVEPRAAARELRAVLAARYTRDPFVEVAGDRLPCLAEVRRTNVCRIGVAAHGDRAVLVSCIDNLVKGAAGQAVQNLNLAFGLDERLGLAAGGPEGWR